MTEERAPALEAGPEADVETEGQTPETEGQAAEAPEQPEAEEQKSEAAKRRERDKALKERLRQEAEDNRRKAEEAEARLKRLHDAGKQERQPEEKDFADFSDYQIAKAAWMLEQRQNSRQSREFQDEAEIARKAAEQAETYEKQLLARQFQEQVAEAKARYADFDAVAFNPTVPVTETMVEMIHSSEMGADLAYHLGKNPALAARIAQMKPIEAAREMGRIEAALSQPKARTQTQAPDPISPVRAAAAGTKDPSKMSFAEFTAWREAGGTF